MNTSTNTKKLGVFVVSALITLSAASSAYAIAGAGFHWGFDFSLSMPNGADSIAVPGMNASTGTGGFDLGKFPGFPDLKDSIIPNGQYLAMSRANWDRSWLNFGGKLFVDIIPFIDIIELSFNLGVWQYDGAVSYIDVDAINKNPALLLPGKKLQYKEVPLTLEEYRMNYFGLNGTPYAKLQFDASVRKIVLNLWLIKFNAGAGMSMNFSTPILNSHLIDDVKADKNIKSPEELVAKFMDTKSGMGKAIVQKILDELFTPRFGAHIVAGAHLKLPVMPIGVYVDGKLMIPISKYDENGEINGLGFLLNTGLSLSF
jgi:hypothetical protein